LGNLTTLPGVTVQNDEPRANIIELIEDLLAEAKAGEIQSLGFVSVNAKGYVATAFATSGLPHAHHLVAGALYLLRRAERNAGVDEVVT
jgi:hypothetical protein